MSVFEAASAELLDEDERLATGKMLHNIGLRSGNGKFFCFERGDDLVVKLPEARVTELIDSGVGGVMDRGQPERPLREWVSLRPGDADACLAYMREAWSFVDPDAAS
ncbi:MAG TPA: hypothetical protein VH231_05315 [Solirubrobacteraceae bacterium]|jgi:hypothetical protein|nr:hypothetical protein [Solirubrobacteraceae bacterium]